MKSYVLVLKTVLLNNFRAVRTRYVRIDDRKQKAKNKLSNATNAALALLGIAVIIVLMSIMTHALAFCRHSKACTSNFFRQCSRAFR